MKILQISKYYYPINGGIETVVFDLAEGLNKLPGICCDVLCFNTERATINYESSRGYKVYRAGIIREVFSAPLSLKYITMLKNLIKDYDVVHIHLPNPVGNLAVLLNSLKHVKLIVHWHSDIVKQRLIMPLYGPLQNMLLKRAHSIVLTSPNYLEGSKELWPYRNKISVVPIGIHKHELPLDSNPLKKKYNGKKVVFALGRHVYYKGFEQLILAAKQLPDDTKVVIGGSGPLTSVYKDLIARHELQDKIELPGRIPTEQLPEYFDVASLFCLPSNHRSEAYGVVLVEALSHGLPLVTTAIPHSGVSWVNILNETGLHAAPNDADSLAECINQILLDENTRRTFALNAFKRFSEQLTADKMVDLTYRLYKSLY